MIADVRVDMLFRDPSTSSSTGSFGRQTQIHPGALIRVWSAVGSLEHLYVRWDNRGLQVWFFLFIVVVCVFFFFFFACLTSRWAESCWLHFDCVRLADAGTVLSALMTFLSLKYFNVVSVFLLTTQNIMWRYFIVKSCFPVSPVLVWLSVLSHLHLTWASYHHGGHLCLCLFFSTFRYLNLFCPLSGSGTYEPCVVLATQIW